MSAAKLKLILLDRDGVINRDSDAYIKSASEWQPIPGSIQALVDLHQAGYQVVICTNQSGLGRGLFDLDDLEAMHDKMRTLVEDAGGEIAAIYYCPHQPEDDCDCRKPKPGMLHAVEADFEMSVRGCRFVGDSLRDLQAAEAAGCQPVLVRSGKGIKTEQALPDSGLTLDSVTVADDLESFVSQFLSGKPA